MTRSHSEGLFELGGEPAGRIDFDSYYTPRAEAEAIVRWLRIPPTWTVWEPHAGGGAFIAALRGAAHTGRIVATDANPASRVAWAATGVDVTVRADCYLADALDVARLMRDPADTRTRDWSGQTQAIEAAMKAAPDVILGNPPYADAAAHVSALLSVGVPVVMLLRSTFLGSDERSELLAEHPPAHVWRFVDRISFVGTSGADSVQHEVVTWLPWHLGDAALSLVRVPGRGRVAMPDPTPPRWTP